MFLSEEELYTLTGRKRPSSRIKVLNQQKIAYRLDGNGYPVVLCSEVEQAKIAGQSKTTEPKWAHVT